jgi:hypothetical protein
MSNNVDRGRNLRPQSIAIREAGWLFCITALVGRTRFSSSFYTWNTFCRVVTKRSAGGWVGKDVRNNVSRLLVNNLLTFFI